MKKYLIIFLTFIILAVPNLTTAQEYTVHDGPSNLEAEVENEGNYTENEEGNYEIEYTETRAELDPSIFENIDTEETMEDKYQLPGYLNYKSWQFWFLLIILFTIFFILIRLLKNLSKINIEIRRHENYLREVKVKKRPKISEKDEILYSEPNDE